MRNRYNKSNIRVRNWSWEVKSIIKDDPIIYIDCEYDRWCERRIGWKIWFEWKGRWMRKGWKWMWLTAKGLNPSQLLKNGCVRVWYITNDHNQLQSLLIGCGRQNKIETRKTSCNCDPRNTVRCESQFLGTTPCGVCVVTYETKAIIFLFEVFCSHFDFISNKVGRDIFFLKATPFLWLMEGCLS